MTRRRLFPAGFLCLQVSAALLAPEPPLLASNGMASLTGSAVTASPGSVAAVSLSLDGSGGPASLEWTLTYDAAAVSALSVDPGPALLAAGKTVTCFALPGSSQCIAWGLNDTPIPDGVVANVTVAPATLAGTISIGVSMPSAATPAGDTLPIGSAASAVTVFSMPALSSFACSPTSLQTPGTVDCTATLSGAAPPGGAAVDVSSDNTSVAAPSSVMVQAGSSMAVFTVTASAVQTVQSATLTAVFNGASIPVPLSLTPPPPPVVPRSIACMPSSLAPGGSATCTLILSTLAPPPGSAVSLSSGNSALAVPALVTVPPGSSSTIFTATAAPVASAQPAVLTAALGVGSAGISLVLNPAGGPALLSVGPGQPYAAPCQALTSAPDGATVQIDAAGAYTADVCTVTANNLTVKGVNGRPLINAAGLSAGGKGAWVLQGNNLTLDTIELTGAAGSGNNAAGVFMAGSNLTVLNSYIHDNQEGVVTAPSAGSQILIQASELNHNGFGDGLTHNADIGEAARFTMQYGYSHNGNGGDLVRSEAAENYILYNRLTSEQGTAETEIELPNGGRSFLIGNLIEKGPADPGADSVAYLSGGGMGSSTELYVVNNTLVSDKSASVNFLNIGASDSTPAVITNNIFYGAGTVSTQSNSVLAANLTGNPLFVNQAAFDYHLSAGSPAIDAGLTPGPADGVSLMPAYEYLDPACGESRNAVGSPDVGAYEYAGAGAPLSCTATVSGLTLNPNTVTGGAATAGNTVTVTVPALSAGTIVTLASSNPNVAAVPASVTVPSGAISAAFSISTFPVASSTMVTISASYGSMSQAAALTVLAPPALSALQCAPATLASNAVSNCVVTLLAPAPAGGVTVNLASSSPLVGIPGAVTVPAGAISTTFAATAGTILSSQSATLSATLNGGSQSAPLTLVGLPGAPANPSPATAAPGISTTPLLSWTPSANATSYDVYFGTSGSPSLIATVTGSSYQSGSLAQSTPYYWKVVANGPGGSTSSPVWSFTTAAPPPVNGVPGSVSASPSSGSGLSQTFTFTYSDSAGYQSLIGVYALITGSNGSNANACWMSYDPVNRAVWLSSDDTSNWSSTAAGAGGSVQNSQCRITGAGVNATGSGTSLSVSFPVTFAAPFAGAKTVFLYAVDTSGSVSPYIALGSWTVPAPAPAAAVLGGASVAPSAGSAMSQAFTFTYSDPAGYQSLKGVYALITEPNGSNANACWISYDPANHLIWLSNDDTSNWSKTAVGSSTPVQNSQCQITGIGVTVTAIGNTLSLTLPVTFSAPFAGDKKVFLYAVDAGGSVSPYVALGSWTVP